MTEDETPSAAAQLRAVAEQAEAEAAEAEALATAARARARAIQLRRQVEVVQADQLAAAPAKEDTNDAGTEREDGATPDVAVDGAVPQHAWYRRWRRSPRPSTVAASFAIVVIFAALVSSGYMFWRHRDASQQRQHAAEFAAAARQNVVNLTSLDFNDAKRDVQRILDVSTGTFKDDFQKMAEDFTKVVEQSQVVERGTVNAAAVDLDSMTKDSAVVLVASTAEVTYAGGAKQDPRKFRLIVTMTRDGDQIKMSKVEFLP